MYIGAFFYIADSSLDIVCYRFDLLLHFGVELALFLLLGSG
jgi:hypothetical protein